MNTETLKKFLGDANKATYANKDAPQGVSLRPGSEDYHFEKDGLVYHDTYFGSRNFVGEEIVYESGKSVWGANYFGFILNDKVSEKEIYDFLREALMQESGSAIPVRGPAHFSSDEKEYRFAVDGDISNFSGEEEISIGGKVVYRCFVHGGMIT